MVSSNIRDILISFNHSSDLFAISSGDGRIKIWDTLQGQVQTEFADLTSSTNDITDFYAKSQSGHLSLDYSCMKWLPLDRKRKKKNKHNLLALGTGSGDVLALDVAVGDLKWRFNDCHPGGVNAISFSSHNSCIYSAGVDGMVCRIDSMSGSLLEKFKASTKAISSMVISSDGNMLATAAAQLKIFNCLDNKKIQKFSGHTGAARCMIFTENSKYVLSSAVGERYIAIWKVDGSKKKSASCVLSMEHPAVFLHSKCINEGTNNEALYVLAISELGLCYFWYGRDIEGLCNAKPTNISLASEEQRSKNHKGALPMIFSAELQGIVKPGSVQVLFAFGSLVKPSFEKRIVEYGVDITLNITQGGVLLPMGQSLKSLKKQGGQTQVTALDRANAEDALLLIPAVHDSHGKKKRHRNSIDDPKDEMAVDFIDKREDMQVDAKGTVNITSEGSQSLG
ncbi:Wd repeat-containing protein [Thalictrum thalictroides]|uniref:Wd repeat-containing protein n=1 Tax=Thalictrum thalictroides TaxID=46969 RepID=A0A7J6W432_THATH|nr:Wd repeat-containing protein [Thalictrum thalictroides]